MLPGCVVSPAAAPPKTDARDNHTNTHIHTRSPTQSDCHVRQAEGGAKKEAKVSVQQRWKNCHVHESRLINSKGQNAQHHSLPSLCPYISSACRRPPLPFPLPYGALDRDANVTRTAAAHSHAPNFHYQMRTFIYKLFLFSCCFRCFLSFFFFSSLSLFVVVIFCVLRCICCSDFSGAYHQSGKSSGKLAACCTQLFACHLMHFLLLISATSLIRFSPAVFSDKPSSLFLPIPICCYENFTKFSLTLALILSATLSVAGRIVLDPKSTTTHTHFGVFCPIFPDIYQA